jgi:glycosyltransferase involved in cell wall biosynthesis
MIQRLPTIVVLHDMAIQELCFDAMERSLLDQDVYLENMRRSHGQAGVEAAELVLGNEMEAGALARTYPGFELALTHAVSVVTHSRVAQQSVDTVSNVHTYLLDLPFRPSLRRPEVYRSGLGPLRLVQFGYTGPNRRLESVLRNLASLKHEVDFRFDVMGKLWDTGYLRNLVNQLGIEARVTFHGFVDESFLDQKLQQAHLVFNLRSPTMGEASGSQLRIWNACAASVVTNLGWYADLPDETVFKINPDREAEELQSIVRSLYADPSRGNRKALAGRERLEQIHNPARYAAAIKKVAQNFSQDAGHSLLGSRCSFPRSRKLDQR